LYRTICTEWPNAAPDCTSSPGTALRQIIFKKALSFSETDVEDWLVTRSPEEYFDDFYGGSNDLDDFLIEFVISEERGTVFEINLKSEAGTSLFFLPADKKWLEARCILLGLCYSTIYVSDGCVLSISKPERWSLDLDPCKPRRFVETFETTEYWARCDGCQCEVPEPEAIYIRSRARYYCIDCKEGLYYSGEEDDESEDEVLHSDEDESGEEDDSEGSE
jgi:hypothetical protein